MIFSNTTAKTSAEDDFDKTKASKCQKTVDSKTSAEDQGNISWKLLLIPFPILIFYMCLRIQLPAESYWKAYFDTGLPLAKLGDNFFGFEYWSRRARLLCDQSKPIGDLPFPSLKCYTRRIWALYPINIEVLSHRPVVVQYHGLFTEQEALEYKDQGSFLKDTVPDEEYKSKPDKVGVLATELLGAPLTTHKGHFADRILARLQAATGIDVSWAEKKTPPVTYYEGAGKNHGPHHDYHTDIKKSSLLSLVRRLLRETTTVCLHHRLLWRSRLVCVRSHLVDLVKAIVNFEQAYQVWQKYPDNFIVNFVFYIQPAEAGGRNIFPYLGIHADGKTGDVVQFPITNADGSRDEMGFHASCPVLKGQKIIGTSRMQIFGQENRLRCPLETKPNWNTYDLESFSEGVLGQLYNEPDDRRTQTLMERKEMPDEIRIRAALDPTSVNLKDENLLQLSSLKKNK